MPSMRLAVRYLLPAVALSAVTLVGCNKKTDDTGNLKTAINSYYDQYPECLWQNAIQLPQQHSKDDASAVQPYDALFDQGLLTRTPVEKTKLLVIKTAANSYDLTDKGRANWTPDPTQPGYGNFCYAHRRVKDITGNTPAGTQPGATTTVNYTWTDGDIKDWARADETQNAFPQLRTALNSVNTAQTKLVLTNDGWKMQAAAPPAQRGAGGDSGIVQ